MSFEEVIDFTRKYVEMRRAVKSTLQWFSNKTQKSEKMLRKKLSRYFSLHCRKNRI